MREACLKNTSVKLQFEGFVFPDTLGNEHTLAQLQNSAYYCFVPAAVQ